MYYFFHFQVYVTDQVAITNICTFIILMFLSPANEVWGKVMFLHLSVILFTVATKAGGTHPTRMHSCYIIIFLLYFYIIIFWLYLLLFWYDGGYESDFTTRCLLHNFSNTLNSTAGDFLSK